jgi:hypothetical protein
MCLDTYDPSNVTCEQPVHVLGHQELVDSGHWQSLGGRSGVTATEWLVQMQSGAPDHAMQQRL